MTSLHSHVKLVPITIILLRFIYWTEKKREFVYKIKCGFSVNNKFNKCCIMLGLM